MTADLLWVSGGEKRGIFGPLAAEEVEALDEMLLFLQRPVALGAESRGFHYIRVRKGRTDMGKGVYLVS
jgi:hypothetical protein